MIAPTGNCAWMLAAPLPFQLKTEFYGNSPDVVISAHHISFQNVRANDGFALR